MKVLDLFSGIGGFSLGLERAGMRTVAFCEIEEFPRSILRKHWPDVPIYDDIRTLTAKRLKEDGIGTIDLICGGFPCQPFSVAGRKMGTEDHRDLWPSMFRLIQECRPAWVIGENVTGFLNMAFERTATDLESEGYEVQPFIIPACAINAPHRRDRVWIIAHSNRKGLEGGDGKKLESCDFARSLWRSLKPTVCRSNHGIPHRMDRIKALGNAVVPQIPEIIGRAIMEIIT